VTKICCIEILIDQTFYIENFLIDDIYIYVYTQAQIKIQFLTREGTIVEKSIRQIGVMYNAKS